MAFTLRFEDETTHEALRTVAQDLGVSMTRLAETFIARELRVAVLGLEDRLSETLDLLRSYKARDVDDALDAFARAEVQEEDPIRTRVIEAETSDPYGLSALFEHRVE